MMMFGKSRAGLSTQYELMVHINKPSTEPQTSDDRQENSQENQTMKGT